MSTTSIAITGMKAAQAIISQTSNNIANSETPGFKSGFMDLSNISGDNGVGMLRGNSIDLKGSFNYTGVVTDLAVSNNKSFFIVQNKNSEEVVNVVTGSFRPNKEGQLEYLGKYLLLGAKYGDDDSLPGMSIDTLEPIVINTSMMSDSVPTTNVVENFNLNSGLLAKGQASFVMTPSNSTPGSKLGDPLVSSDDLESGAGFLLQIKSETNSEIRTESTKCIFTSATMSKSYGSTGTDIATGGAATDDISIVYNGNPAISIARSSIAGSSNSTSLQNIADRINSIIGNNQAYVVTSGGSSQLVIKPPINGSDSLFISGTLATSLNITTQILPTQRGSVRFTSMLDLKNALTGSFSEIDSNASSQSLLFIARPNTNVSFANLDATKDVLGALGMYEGPVLGQGYDPYNDSANMASGNIRPDIVDAVSLYDSKGGQHIANIALKKVEDGWIQEVYMSNPEQIYGARPDGLVQVTKFIFDSKGKLSAAGPVVPNATTSSIPDPYSSIPSPGAGAAGQFSLAGVTFTLGTDFNNMVELVNKINSDANLNANFQATIIKDSTSGYSISIIAKGATQPVVTTNLFNVTNQSPLPDASSPLNIVFNPIEKLDPLNITFDYANMMESVHKEMFGTITANGMGPSTLASISIDSSGDLVGTFANGSSKKLYKIPLATYANVNGLDVIGDNALRASSTSGKMQITSSGAIGEVLSGNIESSNIEQAEELTSLITNKQFYNMNTKSWQTGNAILDYLLNATN